VRFLDRLSLAQRIVAVIAFGLACLAVGLYVAHLGTGTAAFGWYAYAPLSRTANYPLGAQAGLAGWVRLIIWLALTAVWALVSILVLRPARRGPSASEPVS
jgi:heme/copper-type cytochrome/quinol oxidase subunit 1